MSTPLRVVIVDDEMPARMALRALLADEADAIVVAECENGFEAVRTITDLQPDVVLLDVQMPKLDGFEVLELLGRSVPVIFTTAYDEYALRAFEVHAVDYLLKPFSDERFDAALDHARKSLRQLTKTDWISRISNLLSDQASLTPESGRLERIVLKSGGRVTFLELKDLDWISAAGVYLHLHMGERTHLYRGGLTSFLQRLDPKRFVRVHRSTVVNTDRIRELRPRGHGDFTIVLHDGRELTLSRAYRSQLEHWLKQPL
jgi:two-component system LytT family response regulator